MRQPSNTSKLVNDLGIFIYQNIDGAYKISKSSNTCDIYVKISYDEEVPKTMTIDINITTYQEKIRVNTIEMTEYQKTIGHDVYRPDQLKDLNVIKTDIINKLTKRLNKNYPNFNYISV